MTADELRALRTGAQRLHRPRGATAAGLVRHLTGVQAQDLPSAELALRARGTEPTAASVRAARLDERAIVWTWAMRGTLHLLAAEDVRWLLELLAPARIRGARGRLAQLGHEGDTPERAVAAIEALLSAEGPLTRAELAERLAARGFRTEGQATVHLLWFAAMRGVVCHGPERDGAPAFVLLRDWVPEAPAPRDRDAALAELARRHLAAHAPAEPRDLAAFAGVTVTEARAAFKALAGELDEMEGPEGPLWALRAAPPPAAPPGTVRLLPSFDPYLLGGATAPSRSPPSTPARCSRAAAGCIPRWSWTAARRAPGGAGGAPNGASRWSRSSRSRPSSRDGPRRGGGRHGAFRRPPG